MAHAGRVIVSALHSPAFSQSEKQKAMGSLASLKGIVFSFFVRPEFANCIKQGLFLGEKSCENLTIRNVLNVEVPVAANAGATWSPKSSETGFAIPFRESCVLFPNMSSVAFFGATSLALMISTFPLMTEQGR